MASVEDEDPTARIKMRCSVRRFETVIKNLTKKQRGFLIKNGFGMLLNIKYRCAFPISLIDWIMVHIVPATGVFENGNKRIVFNKGMVQQFLGIYSGDRPVKLSSEDPSIIAKVKMIKEKYMSGPKLSTRKLMDLLAGDEDELSFMRTFMMVFLSIIACPATSDTVDWRYLYSLTDLDTIISSDWCSLCLQFLLSEVEKFQKRIAVCPNKPLYVGGCLPILSVSYMDFLVINAEDSQHQINYSVPRINYICLADFQLVCKIDRVHGSSKLVFGALNLRQLSSTPYNESAISEASEKEFARHQQAFRSFAVDSSGRSSSKQQGTSNPATNASNHVENSGDDINNIIASIVQSHKAELLRDVGKLVESRFSLMSKSIDAALSNHTMAGVKSNVIVPETSNVVPVNSADQFQEVKQCKNFKRGIRPRACDRLATHEEEASYSTADREQGGLWSQSFQVDPSIAQQNITSSQAAAFGIDSTSDVHKLPKFDDTPVAFDGSTSKLPVFDKSPNCSTVSRNLRFDDLSNSLPSSSIKGKRKLTHMKTRSSSCDLFKSNASPSVEEFYDKYLDNKFIKSRKEREKIIVVDINDHTLMYEKFYQSFKPRGDISNEAMAAYVEVFNSRVDTQSKDSNSMVKFSFSPYFASKLNVPPESFDVKSVSGELRKLNKKFNLANCDMLNFPVLDGFHWMLLSVNLFFKKIDFLDSLQDADKVNKLIMARNMVTNFQKACAESKFINLDISKFEIESPANIPQQITVFDCGVFVMVYMERWSGQDFKEFSPEAISEFRKSLAHEIGTSSSNNMTSEIPEFKKLKMT